MLKKFVDYEFMPIKKLDKANSRTKLLVMASAIVFFMFSGISCLYAYSFDPILGFAVASFALGVLVLFFVVFFVYGKIIFLIRILTDEGE